MIIIKKFFKFALYGASILSIFFPEPILTMEPGKLVSKQTSLFGLYTTEKILNNETQNPSYAEHAFLVGYMLRKIAQERGYCGTDGNPDKDLVPRIFEKIYEGDKEGIKKVLYDPYIPYAIFKKSKHRITQDDLIPRDVEGKTPFSKLPPDDFEKNKYKIIREYLISYEAKGKTPLHIHARAGNKKIVSDLLTIINLSDADFFIILLYSENLEMIKTFLNTIPPN